MIRSSNNSQLHQTPSSSRDSSCKGCCCCVFLLLSFLALLVLAAMLVIALAVKPKKPQLNLQQVGFQYMSVKPNPSDPTTATLSLTVRLVFAMVNPNRVEIRCGASVSRFCFSQEPHSVREVVATVYADGIHLPPVDAADFTRDASLNDRVKLRVLGNVACCQDSPHQSRFSYSSGLSGLCYSVKSKKVISDLQAA